MWSLSSASIGYFQGTSFLNQDGRSINQAKLIKHIPMGLNRQVLWDRVTAHSIRNKYMNMKCNINNAIKVAYKGEYTYYNVSFV